MVHTVLLVGSGGREDVLAWKLSQSSKVKQVLVVQGNPLMERHSKVVMLRSETSVMGIVSIAKSRQVSLVVIGPEQWIVDGLSDALRREGILVCAPSSRAAQLESSKIYAKEFMREFGIPTPESTACYNYQSALETLSNWPKEQGVVVKVDGLAGGKGVIVCDSLSDAETALFQFMQDATIKVKTNRVLLEQRLFGKEVSAFALLDGDTYRILGYACDHKPVYDQNKGPNTGGMGTYTPENWPTARQRQQINSLFQKVVEGMKARGYPYVGILFAGLMIDGDTVHVLEFNVRMGDPEAQVVLPTLDEDLFGLLWDTVNGDLKQWPMELRTKGFATHVVMTSRGYPSIGEQPVETGFPIVFSDKVDQRQLQSETGSFMVAGVQQQGGHLITSGGRVIGATGIGGSLAESRRKAYQTVSQVLFEGMHFRSDIADESEV